MACSGRLWGLPAGCKFIASSDGEAVFVRILALRVGQLELATGGHDSRIFRAVAATPSDQRTGYFRPDKGVRSDDKPSHHPIAAWRIVWISITCV